MNEYKDFSSLPPETEREFVVYEKTSVEAGKKAKVIALGVAFGFLAIVMAIVFSFPKPHNLMAEDDMSGLAAPDKDGKEAKAEGEKAKAEGEKPKTEGAAPAADKPAEGAAAGAEGAAPAADKPAEGAAPAGDKPAEGAEAGKPDGKTEDK